MKANVLTTLIPVVICLAGCASMPTVTTLDRVGPGPARLTSGQTNGALQVYSARQQALLPEDSQELVASRDFFTGESDSLQRELPPVNAHTGYRIYGNGHKLLKQVRNAAGVNDATPTTVALPPGNYLVTASAATSDSAPHPVRVPVVIEPGRTTVVHLDGMWHPRKAGSATEMIRLPDGQIVGWRAQPRDNPQLQGKGAG